MTEEELSHQIRQYQELKKHDKNIDVTSLALTALQSHQANRLSPSEKRVGYLVSFFLPPFGLLYAYKFYTSAKSDGKIAAYLCIAITVLPIIFLWILTSFLVTGSGATLEQIQQISPQDYQQLLQ